MTNHAALAPLPPIGSLGRDLRETSRLRLVYALCAPFMSSALYFAFALRGSWVPAVLCVAFLSFITYGSTSHDLVHRNLGLPRRWNDLALTAIELLALRSGRAYRISHRAHHRHFPGPEDAEGRCAEWGLAGSLLIGPVYIPWLWVWSFRRATHERRWIALETFAVLAYLVVAVATVRTVPALLVYACLVYGATWVFPLALVYLQHDPRGVGAVRQTRRYRGRIVPALLMQHLYHLEHHLYPMVPAHHWRELSRRVDPLLDAQGATVIRVP